MEIDENGRIAYHSLLFVENGLDFVQYDFEGKEVERKAFSRYTLPDITTP